MTAHLPNPPLTPDNLAERIAAQGWDYDAFEFCMTHNMKRPTDVQRALRKQDGTQPAWNTTRGWIAIWAEGQGKRRRMNSK